MHQESAEPSRQGDDVGVARMSGELTAWGPGGRRLLGLDPEETVGRSFFDLFSEPAPSALRRCWAGRETWSGMVLLRHREGHVKRAGIRLRPLSDGAGDTIWVIDATGATTGGDRTGELALLKQWAIDQMPLPVTLCDRGLVRIAVNPAVATGLGRAEQELVGFRLGEDARGPLPPPLRAVAEAAEQVLRTGEPVAFEPRVRTPRDAAPRAWLSWVYPVRDPEGQVRAVALAAADSTAQYQARLRLNVLNEASERVGTTLDLARTADELAQVATEHFADFVTVDILDGVLRAEEGGGVDPGETVAFRRVAQRSVLPSCPESGVKPGQLHTAQVSESIARALKAVRPVLGRPDDLDAGGRLPATIARSMAVEHGIHSIVAAPLHARGVMLGLATFFRHSAPNPFNDEDLRLAGELCSRAAVYIDNARRYTRERLTSLALQRTLLPERVPFRSAAAVDIASRYLPATAAIGIGGDWFDVIPLSGARVALVVGDVVGHGIHASATMGRLCTAVRTLADADVTPDELLTQLDDLVLRLDEQAAAKGSAVPGTELAEVGATCLYAVYDPVSGRCAMARAGHPLPVLVTPDGSVRFLEPPAGPPLGVGGLPFEVAEFDTPEGSVLAFYTDGLVGDARGEPEAELRMFREALAVPGRELETACDALLSHVPAGRHSDDAALLLVRTKALTDDQVAVWQLTQDPSGVAEARRSAMDVLAAWNLRDQQFVTELVISELVTNALRYGKPPVQLRLIRDTVLICEVSDTSSTAPHLRRARTFDEGGRGLLIVAQLTRRWGSRQTPTGKTIWAEIPIVPSTPPLLHKI
ncbi:SpoIIE family protein phosphatase [Streptomyces sp. NPDC001508]|uniref:SpoIIE family protein phosphatase n=1 Tax=Streptomyces sp. NPDC001508 TaxID=3154656 RepID=UPI00331CEC6F